MDRSDPTAILTSEHGLISRVVADIRSRTSDAGGRLDPHYALTLADFFKEYADVCHHGKEEHILFERLGMRDLTPEDAKAMNGLIREHEWARATTAKVREAGDRYAHGDAGVLGDITKSLKALAQFYPQHAKKEEESFFPASRRYFSDDEWRELADAFGDFDRELIHRRYEVVVEALEAGEREAGDREAVGTGA